jgi:hypothetical protein
LKEWKTENFDSEKYLDLLARAQNAPYDAIVIVVT